MSTKEKIIAVLLFPIVLLLIVVEPFAVELYTAFIRIKAGIAENYNRVKNVYLKELWK